MNLEKIIELEALISAEVKKDNISSLNFQYEATNENITARVFTFNSKTREFFLLASCTAVSVPIALEEILAYVTTHKDNMSSYTVKWSRKSAGTEIFESYFYCKSPREVLDKFYTGKDEAMYTIYSLSLNPIA